MISVVFSTRVDNQKHIEHIKKTSGIHKGLEVIQYINNGEYSLTELYNKALKETTNDIVVFCHDDIIFETNNWGNKILKHFKRNPEYGILGVAGSTYLPKSGKWWEIPYTMRGIVNHQNNGQKWESKYSEHIGNKLYDVTLVDGLFFVINKNNLLSNFNENVEGFHLYDVSFCFDNYIKGVKIGVITDIRLTHLSIGETNEQWEKNREVFAENNKENLPINIDTDVSLSSFMFCHDQEIILKYIDSDKFKNIKNLTYVFVSNNECDKIENLDNVIIAKNYDINLEDYPNFTAFTGWYLLWKNNLIKTKYVNLIEYDIEIVDEYNVYVENLLIKEPKIVSYVPFSMLNYHFINNGDWVNTIFSGIKEKYKIDLKEKINNIILRTPNKNQLIWGSTSNVIFHNEIFNHYMKWFEPLVEFMKDDKNAGHGFERSITFFSIMKNVPLMYLPNVLKHIQMDSHKTQGHEVTHKI
jgi:hypothetical protein